MNKEMVVSLLVSLAGLTIFILFIYYQASVNAKVYNRETNSNISIWEAVWADIRTDCK